MSEWRGGGEGKILVISSAPPPTPPTLTGQVSNYDPRWRHRKPDLSSVPLQNNGCTAGYYNSATLPSLMHDIYQFIIYLLILLGFHQRKTHYKQSPKIYMNKITIEGL